jgi:hypothetical protein
MITGSLNQKKGSRNVRSVISFAVSARNNKGSRNGRSGSSRRGRCEINFAVFAKKTLRPLRLNLSTIAYKAKSAPKMRIFAKTLLHENRLSES